MNKIYMTALATLFVAQSATAQRVTGNGLTAPMKKEALMRAYPSQDAAASNGQREVVWSSDFSSASDWEIGTIPGFNADQWVIGTNGPSGTFSIPVIASTTASNGFALFDSDLLCGGNQNTYIQMANPVDLSDHANVMLEFQEAYRRYYDSCFVETSVNGSTWTRTAINLISTNTSVANPTTVSLNLSSQIGGQEFAWVRFRFQGTCDYSWMIDDVKILTLPDNEIELLSGYVAHNNSGVQYGRVPQQQLGPELFVGGDVLNFGSNTQTNVVVNVSLLDPSSASVATLSSSPFDVAPTDTVSSYDPLDLPTTVQGIYTAAVTVTSDQIAEDENPNNNAKDRTFAITNGLYSLDGAGVYPTAALEQVGTNSFTNNSADVRFLNYYEISSPTTANAVEIRLGSASAAGSFLNVTLHDTASVFNNDLDAYLMDSEFYTITAADITAGVAVVPFTTPVDLEVDAYFVSANLYSDGDNHLYVVDDVTVPQPNAAAMLWIPVDANNQNLYGGNGTAWGVRLHTNFNVSVAENGQLPGISMFPNPTDGLLRINNVASEQVTVDVFNVLGSAVQTAVFNTNTVLDLSSHAAGVYNVRVSNGKLSTVKRIVLQ